MKIGWLHDDPGYVGGAELTQTEFRAAAPRGVRIIDCPAGEVKPGLDRYVAGNIQTYSESDLRPLAGREIFRYHHDMRDPDRVKATHIFCSPLQRESLGMEGEAIPPALDLDRFREAARTASERAGACCVAAWMNPGKAAYRAAEWAQGEIDFYGEGPFAPADALPLSYEQVPEVLAKYQTFVFLPIALEPFGRAVVEAWAAGLDLVLNQLVGARHWIEEAPEKLESAAEDFWGVVLG